MTNTEFFLKKKVKKFHCFAKKKMSAVVLKAEKENPHRQQKK